MKVLYCFVLGALLEPGGGDVCGEGAENTS